MTTLLQTQPTHTAAFAKYHALGNDMLVLNPATFSLPLSAARVQLLCHRHFGLGADGLCYGPLPAASGPNEMRFWNPDGTEAEKSGNGLRIFARYLWDARLVHGRLFSITIHNQPIQAELLDDHAHTIALTLGRLTFNRLEEEVVIAGQTMRLTAVTIGNPHCILFHHDLTAIHTLGPLLESAPLFPQRTNVQLVRPLDDHTIEIAIWERGAGYTLASGTSASAAAGAAIRTGRCRSPVTVRMAGGELLVAIDAAWEVTQTGPVTAVAHGTIAPDLLHELGMR